MEKKEYLNEEEYLKNAKKLKGIGKIALIIGIATLALGFILLVLGFTGIGKAGADSIGSFDTNPSGIISSAFGGFGMFALGALTLSAGFTVTIVGIVISVIAHRREITAFAVQQTMPIAQEGIEKMTPTVSNAAGSLAQSITKGIKEGLKDSEEKQ